MTIRLLLPFSQTAVLLVLFSSCGKDSFEDQVLEYLRLGDGDVSADFLESHALSVSSDGKEFRRKANAQGFEESIGLNDFGEVVFKGGFRDGQAEGEWTTFFSDGKPRWQGMKENGLNHGFYRMWYESGRRKANGAFRRGKKHGEEISWYENGNKWHLRYYSAGKPVGVWKSWDQAGKLQSEVFHSSMNEVPGGSNE